VLLLIFAVEFTPVDSSLIPTGELRPVDGTPFDFRMPHAIGERIRDASDQQIVYAQGYDHNFVLREHELRDMVITIRDPKYGCCMEGMNALMHVCDTYSCDSIHHRAWSTILHFKFPYRRADRKEQTGISTIRCILLGDSTFS